MGRPKYYDQAYIEHMGNPQNVVSIEGPDWPFDGLGVMAGPRLRTNLMVWVSLGEGPGRPIQRVAWYMDGVPEAVAQASALSEFLNGGTLSAIEGAALGVDEVGALLGSIPQRREEPTLRLLQALRRALNNAGALGLPPGDGEDFDSGLACHCVGVSFGDLRALAQVGVTPLALQKRTAFGTGCGTCLMAIHSYLDGLEG